MLTMRLSRTGRTKKYSYRIVLQDHRESLVGNVIEILGHYNPAMKEKPLVVEQERVTYWISKGAQPSDTLATILKKAGMKEMEKYIGPRGKKRVNKNEEKAPAAAPQAAAPAVKAEEKVEEKSEAPVAA